MAGPIEPRPDSPIASLYATRAVNPRRSGSARIGSRNAPDVVITYAPSASGSSSALLNIGNDDPDEAVVEVALSGTGVVVEPPPSEQIQAILDFFDESVEQGTLHGDGPGNSAANRLNALRNMLETAGDLIDGELIDDACQQLADAYKKTDGDSPPPDFVTGEAATELAAKIEEIMTSLGCD